MQTQLLESVLALWTIVEKNAFRLRRQHPIHPVSTVSPHDIECWDCQSRENFCFWLETLEYWSKNYWATQSESLKSLSTRIRSWFCWKLWTLISPESRFEKKRADRCLASQKWSKRRKTIGKNEEKKCGETINGSGAVVELAGSVSPFQAGTIKPTRRKQWLNFFRNSPFSLISQVLIGFHAYFLLDSEAKSLVRTPCSVTIKFLGIGICWLTICQISLHSVIFTGTHLIGF